MKRVEIPMFQQHLRIFRADEKAKFERVSGDLDKNHYACQCGDAVWIGADGGVDPIGTCYHEATHFVDWLLEERIGLRTASSTLWETTELRAYMVQWVGDKIREYCCDG